MTTIDALARVAGHERAAVITDYDGTLAPIIDDPARATPLPAAADALHALVDALALVAVVSGRPVDFLHEHLPFDGLTIVGQYGLERLVDGEIVVDPRALAYADAVARAATDAASTWPGLNVERKGRIAVTLHWRTRPDVAPSQPDLDAFAAGYGLVAHPGRRSCELRTPVPVDKGTTVDELLAMGPGCAHAAFFGDDAGDLSAFDALDRCARRADGTDPITVKVAVRSPEAPPDLLRRADLVVDGPQGVADALRSLAPR